MKKCSGPCERIMEDAKFYIRRYKDGSIGLRSYCIECNKNRRNIWRKENKDWDDARNNAYNKANYRRIRGEKLKKYWPGSTWKEALDNYESLLAKQNGVCAICRKTDGRTSKESKTRWRLAVDHCYSTLKIRGLLCNSCNRGLGLLGDTASSLFSAYEYLQNSENSNILSQEGHQK